MTTDARLERFYRGEPLVGLRPKLNSMVDAHNRALSSGAGAPLSLNPDAVATQLAVVQIKAFLAHPELEVVYAGETGNASAVTLSAWPPWTLYEAGRDGVTYSYASINQRTAIGATTEIEHLWPSYVVGDRLLCALVPDYETAGLWRWQDLNIDGRQWVVEESSP